MPVISIASSKGGAGKTTTAIILATTLARHTPVVVIDADAGGNLSAWYDLQPVDKIKLVRSKGEHFIQDEIDAARRSAKIVIVDLEGIASKTNSYAMSESDLVIIPCMEGQQEVNKAVQTLNEIRRESRAIRRPIKHAVLIVNNTPAANFKTRTGKMLNASLREATRVMSAELHKWSAIEALHNQGGGLHDLPPEDFPNIAKAIRNARSVTEETLEILKEGIKTNA